MLYKVASFCFATFLAVRGDLFDELKKADLDKITSLVGSEDFDATSVFVADTGDKYSLLEFATLESKNPDVLRVLLRNADVVGDNNANVVRAYHRVCEPLENSSAESEKAHAKHKKPLIARRKNALSELLQSLGTENVDALLPDDASQNTLLMRCVDAGFYDLSSDLVQTHGANVNAQDADGSSALHRVMRFPQKLDAQLAIEEAEALDSDDAKAEWRADGHRLVSSRRAMMDSLTHFASLLLDNGADVNLVNNAGDQWEGGHLARMHEIKTRQSERQSKHADEAKERMKDFDPSRRYEKAERDLTRKERYQRARERRRKRAKDAGADPEDYEMDMPSMADELDDDWMPDPDEMEGLSRDERRKLMDERRRRTRERIRRKRKRRRMDFEDDDDNDDMMHREWDDGRDFMGEDMPSFDREDMEKRREERRQEMEERMDEVRRRHEEMRARHESDREDRRRKRQERYGVDGSDFDPDELRETLRREREDRRRELDERMRVREDEREERRKEREERRQKRREKREKREL